MFWTEKKVFACEVKQVVSKTLSAKCFGPFLWPTFVVFSL